MNALLMVRLEYAEEGIENTPFFCQPDTFTKFTRIS